MKRRSLTFFIAVVFLVWNVMTYLFVARGPPSTRIDDPADIMGHQLLQLESRLKEQVDIHTNLLKQLEAVRADLQKSILEQNVPEISNQKKNGSQAVQQVPQLQQPHNLTAQHSNIDPNKVALPVLVFACNRPTVKRNLDQLLNLRPSAERFPIIVSQDCGHGPTAEAIRSYGTKLTHIQHPDLSDIQLPWPQRKFQGYYKIARHYKWALHQIFHKFNYDAVIIVEDDLDISPDFFEYFAATFPILRGDPSLWCVSAWNDNGKTSMVEEEPELLYRTDFFPGLGWMVEKHVWLELEDKWPATFWDDWMRHPDQRKDRACIRPEICRTSTFGKVGVSKGQYYDKHLKFIKLNDKAVPFTKRDLSYLKKDRYDEEFVQKVYSMPLFTSSQVLIGAQPEHRAVRVQYTDKQSYKTQAKQLGIMDDLKSGVPRAGYRGVVSFLYKGRRIYLAPPPNWNGYDVTWN